MIMKATSIERLSWSLYPYVDTSLFDPDDPIRFTVGAELLAKYKFLPSTSISGSLEATHSRNAR